MIRSWIWPPSYYSDSLAHLQEKFMNEHIKVNNKTNNLGDVVAVSTTDNKLCVTVSTQMAKRYLKVGEDCAADR